MSTALARSVYKGLNNTTSSILVTLAEFKTKTLTKGVIYCVSIPTHYE